MVEHEVRIPLEWSHGASVFVFGDIQGGQSGFQKEAWEEFENEFRRTPNAWALGLGDYDDWLRPSLRPALRAALGKDDSARAALDKMVQNENDKTIDAMQFLDGKLLGLHEGHHNWKMASGINTDQRIASALHATYLGFAALTRIALEIQRKKSKAGRGGAYVYNMLSTHGNANGKKVHSALSFLEGNYTAAFVCDHYIMGHGCKSGNETPFERHTARRNGPVGWSRSLPRVLVVGGFTRAYTNGWESDYVERAGMTPQPPGWAVIEFKLSQRQDHAIAKGVNPHAVGHATTTLDVNHFNRHPAQDYSV